MNFAKCFWANWLPGWLTFLYASVFGLLLLLLLLCTAYFLFIQRKNAGHTKRATKKNTFPARKGRAVDDFNDCLSGRSSV